MELSRRGFLAGVASTPLLRGLDPTASFPDASAVPVYFYGEVKTHLIAGSEAAAGWNTKVLQALLDLSSETADPVEIGSGRFFMSDAL